MDVGDAIRKHGFRRWYERQLNESVLWFTTCFVCMIAVFACLEEFGARDRQLPDFNMLVMAAAAAGLGAASWRRFKLLLVRAEHLGDLATCTACQTYARFQVLESGRRARAPVQEVDAEENLWMRVRCRRCGHEWTMR